MRIFDWLRKTAPAPASAQARESIWSTHVRDRGLSAGDSFQEALMRIAAQRPKIAGAPGTAMDDWGSGIALKAQLAPGNIPESLLMWYASQGFIGYQVCAILAQHWLIDKVCTVPARDAIRKGYSITSFDGEDLDENVIKMLNRYDRAMRVRWHLEQFVRMGRIFGIRIALFRVESTDPEYYYKPFNIDGVTPGSYKGIVQVDPYWTAPLLDGAAAAQPDSPHFYEPTWWIINGQRYHRSHLVIYRHSEPADLLKPQYLYGGVPVPQRIMERVYAAERTANEAPQLAMTKRLNVWLTDMSKFVAQGEVAIERLNWWAQMRDNYGVKLGDKEGDEFQQFETSLADLDAVIMTQYQIVCSAANVPSTKLLGTQPKGFNATGEYEEASYHEDLESIQAHDLTPLLERHHLLCMKSYIEPKFPGMRGVEITVQWQPLDAPTAEERAQVNLVKAQTGQALVASGAITSEDEHNRIARDPDAGYPELGDYEEPPPDQDVGSENDPAGSNA